MKKALVIVDMQNDFVHPYGKLQVPYATDIISTIQELKKKAKAKGVPVIYTQDWHTKDDAEFKVWPEHCVENTLGAEIIDELKPEGGEIAKLYPELFKCIGCNTCTRSCPMDIEVMEYVSQAIRGNIEEVAKLSFDCVMCGLCSARCPAEEVQYNFAILCRRLYGKYIAPRAEHLAERVKQIEKGKFSPNKCPPPTSSGR